MKTRRDTCPRPTSRCSWRQMPKVLWHTFNSASVFQSGRSECHSWTSCLLQREGPIRFVVSCLSEQNLLFRKRALNSSRMLWLEKLVVPHMYVAAVPPCGYANQKLTAPHSLPPPQPKLSIMGEITHWHVYRQNEVWFLFPICFMIDNIRLQLNQKSNPLRHHGNKSV